MDKIELLAPAGDLEKLKTAVDYGADAVYFGGELFSLRAGAGNLTIPQMEEGIAYAHARNVRCYLTLNIFAHNEDILPLEDYLIKIKALDIDAFIVSDPGIMLMIREVMPQAEIHLSTQANMTNYMTARFWQQQGVKRIVLARELTFEELRYLKNCGADRYLLKHETADPELYDRLHPCGTLKERVECLKNINRLGYETGSGFMIGLPGQTLETIASDLLLLKELNCKMAGIGPFIPHPDTPLAVEKAGDTELTKRAVALARLLLPKANLPVTTSLGVVNREEKDNAFACGANVIMKKVTPDPYKQAYEIYPAKLEKTDVIGDRKKLEEQIRQLGRIPL